MVLATATALIVEYIPPSKYSLYGASLTALYAVRHWAGGYTNREERDLNNKTFILVVCSFPLNSPPSQLISIRYSREHSLALDSLYSTI